MYQIVRYPDKYAIYNSKDYNKCVQYLTDFNNKLRDYKFKTEKTETFITLATPYKEDTVYSIEYNDPAIVKNIYRLSDLPVYGSKEWNDMCERFFGGDS